MENKVMYEGVLWRFAITIEDPEKYKQIQIVIARRINDILIPVTIRGKLEQISTDNLHIIQ
jgi:hypothetical protein